MPIWLSIPIGVRDDLVRKITIDIADGTVRTMEVDSDGNIVPFGSKSLGTVSISQENFLNQKSSEK
jgi:hypothetical protein